MDAFGEGPRSAQLRFTEFGVGLALCIKCSFLISHNLGDGSIISFLSGLFGSLGSIGGTSEIVDIFLELFGRGLLVLFHVSSGCHYALLGLELCLSVSLLFGGISIKFGLNLLVLRSSLRVRLFDCSIEVGLGISISFRSSSFSSSGGLRRVGGVAEGILDLALLIILLGKLLLLVVLGLLVLLGMDLLDGFLVECLEVNSAVELLGLQARECDGLDISVRNRAE
jgi:hypothetical protein